jgi:hypothetical protein
MIRRLTGSLLAGFAAALISCGGVSKQELETVRAELVAKDAQLAADLKKDLTGIDQKYVTVQQLQNMVKNELEDMAKLRTELTELGKALDAKAQVAAGQVLKALQFEEKLMSERLAELRHLIEELKKK